MPLYSYFCQSGKFRKADFAIPASMINFRIKLFIELSYRSCIIIADRIAVRFSLHLRDLQYHAV